MSWMSLSDILYLYRARLGARAVLVQEGLAVLGIAVGVALLFASQVASTSLTGSVQELTKQLFGNTQFQLDARSPAGFSERLLGEVRGIPGVRVGLPVLEQQANVIGPSGQRSVDLIGADPRFAGFAGSLLRHFSVAQLAAQHAIALPAPIAQAIDADSLQIVRLQLGARAIKTLVGATLDKSEIGGLVNSPVAVAPITYAQHLGELEGRLSRIFIQVEPGLEAYVHSRLMRLAAAANVNLEPANFDSTLFAVAVAPQNRSETLFSAISALVGFMFALNAMLVTVPARRKLIEELRPAGATRAMALQILLFDAAVLGVLACVIGLALGELLSIVAFRATPGYLSSAFPVGNDRIVTWESVALAVSAGLAAATLGVLWPLRDVLRDIDSKEHLGDEKKGSLEWVHARVALGLVCLLITTIVLVLRPQNAFDGCVTLVVALVCLLPSLFDGIVALFERSQGLFNGAASVMATMELQAPHTRVRSLAIAATGAIAVFGTVAIGGAQANLERGLDAAAREGDATADVWVVPNGESSVLATTPFRPTDLARLAHVPGVRSVGLYRGGFLTWGDKRLWAIAPPDGGDNPVPTSQLVAGNHTVAVARVRRGGWAVLSQALATERHLKIGDTFVLPSPQPVRLRVAALSTNLGWPPGAIILNSDDYARAWASGDPSEYAIETDPGVSLASVRRLARHALGNDTALVVETTPERQRRHYALAAQGLARLTQIKLLLLIAAIIAVSGAMIAMIWQRRDRVAFIKCQGFQRGVLWRWLLAEGAVLLGIGCLIGAVFGIFGQLLISHALGSVTGFPIVFEIEALAALWSFALVSVAALAMIALPGYLVVRVPARTVSPAY
jgi:putative ABC transport system permease protein